MQRVAWSRLKMPPTAPCPSSKLGCTLQILPGAFNAPSRVRTGGKLWRCKEHEGVQKQPHLLLSLGVFSISLSPMQIIKLEKVSCGPSLCGERSHFLVHTRRNVIVLVSWVYLTRCQRTTPNIGKGSARHDCYIMRCETAWIIQCFARERQLHDGLHGPENRSMGWCDEYTTPKCTFGERAIIDRPNCRILCLICVDLRAIFMRVPLVLYQERPIDNCGGTL